MHAGAYSGKEMCAWLEARLQQALDLWTESAVRSSWLTAGDEEPEAEEDRIQREETVEEADRLASVEMETETEGGDVPDRMVVGPVSETSGRAGAGHRGAEEEREEEEEGLVQMDVSLVQEMEDWDRVELPLVEDILHGQYYSTVHLLLYI